MSQQTGTLAVRVLPAVLVLAVGGVLAALSRQLVGDGEAGWPQHPDGGDGGDERRADASHV